MKRKKPLVLARQTIRQLGLGQIRRAAGGLPAEDATAECGSGDCSYGCPVYCEHSVAATTHPSCGDCA